MSTNVQEVVVEPGDDRYVEEAWVLKERIRREDSMLRQRKSFFTRAYRKGTAHCIRDPEAESMLAFGVVRRDGYLLFLAVDPEYRREGFGRHLIGRITENQARITCHARTTNEAGLAFYESLGFEIVRTIERYYEDGGDAHYLELDETSGITEKLSSMFRR